MRHENQIARDIVANLYWRWRLSKRLLSKYLINTPQTEHSNQVQYLWMLYNNENSDWNSFNVSYRILLGGKP